MKTMNNMISTSSLKNTTMGTIFSNIKSSTGLILGTVTLLLFSSNPLMAGAADDPLLAKYMFDQFEVRDENGEKPFVFEGQFWFGYDLEKLWIKTEYESVNGETEELELQVLYSKAIAPYWEFQIGLRKDFSLDSVPGRNWAVIGFQGLAPYFFEIDSALFIGDSGDTALRFEAEYEWMFTQKIVLSPEMEVNFYGQDDPIYGTGSGLSDIQLGLRLRYEVKREFAPYIGINWTKKFGGSADYALLEGFDSSDTQFVVGFRAWF